VFGVLQAINKDQFARFSDEDEVNMKVYAKQLGIVLQDFSMQNNEVNQVSESGGDGEDRPKRVSSGPTMEYVKEERDHEVEKHEAETQTSTPRPHAQELVNTREPGRQSTDAVGEESAPEIAVRCLTARDEHASHGPVGSGEQGRTAGQQEDEEEYEDEYEDYASESEGDADHGQGIATGAEEDGQYDGHEMGLRVSDKNGVQVGGPGVEMERAEALEMHGGQDSPESRVERSVSATEGSKVCSSAGSEGVRFRVCASLCVPLKTSNLLSHTGVKTGSARYMCTHFGTGTFTYAPGDIYTNDHIHISHAQMAYPHDKMIPRELPAVLLRLTSVVQVL
jgi:hypothetical protein